MCSIYLFNVHLSENVKHSILCVVQTETSTHKHTFKLILMQTIHFPLQINDKTIRESASEAAKNSVEGSDIGTVEIVLP